MDGLKNTQDYYTYPEYIHSATVLTDGDLDRAQTVGDTV